MAREHFEKLDEKRVHEPVGPNESCEYYPCHFDGQDCTWCFCPLYPCLDEELGEWIEAGNGSEVWSCKNCHLVHRPEPAKVLLQELLRLGNGSVLCGVERLEKNRELKEKILEIVKKTDRRHRQHSSRR
ncbi:cysteine-rich small domain-containing protein [Methanopyrus sp.]